MKRSKAIRSAQHMNVLIEGFWKKTLRFTEKLLVLLTIGYFANCIVSVVLILFAINQTGNFSYLDTLITETSVTFRDIVGIAIIKFAVENVFRYNDFGGRVPSKPVPPDEGAFVVEEAAAEPADEAGAEG